MSGQLVNYCLARRLVVLLIKEVGSNRSNGEIGRLPTSVGSGTKSPARLAVWSKYSRLLRESTMEYQLFRGSSTRG